jgi:hypothetical protein
MTDMELRATIAHYIQQHPSATGHEIGAAMERHQVDKFHTAATLRDMTRSGILARTAHTLDGHIDFRYTLPSKPQGDTTTLFVTNARRLGEYGEADVHILTPDGDIMAVPDDTVFDEQGRSKPGVIMAIEVDMTPDRVVTRDEINQADILDLKYQVQELEREMVALRTLVKQLTELR